MTLATGMPGRDIPNGARWQAWLARLLLVAVAGYLLLAWAVGGARTLDSIARIPVGWFLAGLVLTMASFGLRIVRWQMLMRGVGARVPWPECAAIYLAGIALTASPGKVGETVRSAFLLRFGVRVGSSLAAFFVDRLSDVLAVLLLAVSASGFARGVDSAADLGWLAVLAAAVLLAALLRGLVRSGVLRAMVRGFPAGRRLRRAGEWLDHAGQDFVGLWRPRVALPAVGLAVLAYGLQGLIYAGMVHAVAPQVGVATAVAIFAASTLAGAASLLPGGLGAMELALVALLGLEGVEAAPALAAALGLRVVTFWFGLVLGAAGLSLAARKAR